MFFLVVLIVGLIYSPSILFKIADIKEWTINRYPEPEGGWPKLIDFWVTCASAFIIFITIELTTKVTYPLFYYYCKEKNDEELRVSKTIKSCTSFYKMNYYFAACVWGYVLMKDLYFIPPALLGNGRLEDIETKYPYSGYPPMFRYYYLGTMGFHLYSSVHHLFHKARNDFWEMVLHHGATLFLYGVSYYLYRFECGAIIMFLHDWADVPTSFIKCFSETIFTRINVLGITCMALLWLYTRLYLFPYVIYYALSSDPYEGHYPIVAQFCGLMLCSLLILHVYWFFVLLKCLKKYI
jgi:hypothetical protein